MATLDELFDTAGDRLRTAAAAPSPDRAATAGHLDRFLTALVGPLALDKVDTPRSAVTNDLAFRVGRAGDVLQSAQRLLPSPDTLGTPGTAPAESHLLDASAAVEAVRDVIQSHHGPDRVPLSAYAYALTTGPAHHYLTRRCAELAWGAAQVASSLARDTLDPSAAGAFADVRRFLSEASVFGRDGTRDADAAIGALPLMLPVDPVQTDSADRPQDVTAHLAEDCDRLSRAAFETLHHRSDHRMSGSDLQQLARWTAMQRLLAGRVLLRAAEELPEQTAAGLRQSAEALRGSAQAWQKSATAWQRIVDTADPRSHPKLPAPSYEVVRRGEVVRLPQVLPHPSTVIARTAAVRVGQLLYGAEWRPELTTRPDPRKGAAILADARGPGALAAALYRLPATGWQLALAAPQAVNRARGGLVTDVFEHQAPGLKAPGLKDHRFRPIAPQQLKALAAPYTAVLPAEQASAVSLLDIADQAGVPVPRALLDATAHRGLAATAARGWTQPRKATVRPVQPRLRPPQPQVLLRRRGL
ncbi:hypothetical protein [Streptomyces sp. NBC_01012]|uniref:hypothetical protein n=1 Tax=Streptomyces sp. NBC_01012 TaxID=2903717 RepID=UPI002F9167EE|nr:hypothetical protein OG623_34950 [Streptomyces sp. NBC_01012]